MTAQQRLEPESEEHKGAVFGMTTIGKSQTSSRQPGRGGRREKEVDVSEERRPVHPQEPAEGAEENEAAPGAERSGDPSNPETAEGEGQGSPHPQEPAEGGDDETDVPGADKAGNSG